MDPAAGGWHLSQKNVKIYFFINKYFFVKRVLTFKNAASKHTALPNILILPECSERRPIILSVTFIFSNNVVYKTFIYQSETSFPRLLGVLGDE